MGLLSLGGILGGGKSQPIPGKPAVKVAGGARAAQILPPRFKNRLKRHVGSAVWHLVQRWLESVRLPSKTVKHRSCDVGALQSAGRRSHKCGSLAQTIGYSTPAFAYAFRCGGRSWMS